MKRLFLLRHAKTGAGSVDHERALTAAGAQDAAAMGRFMARKGYRPDVIFCSSALRTRASVQHLLNEWPQSPPVEYHDALYQADPAQLMAAARDAGTYDAVMLVAHNPGLEQCAALLARAEPKADNASRDALSLLEDKFPPGALAVLDFAITDWRALREHDAALTAFVRPKDL